MRQQGSQLGTELLDIALLFGRQKKFQSSTAYAIALTYRRPMIGSRAYMGPYRYPAAQKNPDNHNPSSVTHPPPLILMILFCEAPLRTNLGKSQLQFLLTSVNRSPGFPLSHVKRIKIRGFAFPLQGWWHRQHACRCCEPFASPHYQGIAQALQVQGGVEARIKRSCQR